MALGMSIMSNNLRHSGSMFILLRVVRIRTALLMWTEVESKGVELNMGVGFRWGACGRMNMNTKIHLRVDKHAGGP